MIISGLFLLFMIGVTSLSACAQQDNQKSIEGKWRLRGELPGKDGKPGMAWFLEWIFTDGKFLQTGYPPISQKGKYRILKKDGDKLTLELYEQSGNFGTEDKQIEIIIDAEKETLKINGKEGFKRVKK